jgi:predicted nuclease with TOPRIM domain
MQELENKKAALELLQNETNDKLQDYRQQISILQKQIDDYNKPALTPLQYDAIHDAVEKAVENYSFSDCDNYEVDFSLDYDGRVQLESIDLQDTYQLVEMIVDKVSNLFKEVDCPEDGHFTETIKEQTS